MTPLDEKLRAVGAMWGGADYDALARRLGPVHDRLVEALGARPGERWLDLATGTGAVALRAARAGADVTAVDISERLLRQARAAAEEEGLDVELVLADVRDLPLPDAGFDAVSSCFGVIFAPDPPRTAAELGRVCRPGGRLGLATWSPDPEFDGLWDAFLDEPAPLQADEWGEPERVEALLGGDFELETQPGTWSLESESLDALWAFFVSSAPPLKALHASLEPERGAELRDAFVRAHRDYVREDGSVCVRREYLLVLGRRR